MANSLRILHISDLHERVALPWMSDERKAKVRVGAAERYRVLDGGNFHDQIRSLRKEGPIDLVCFTGDIADWALKEEYALASERIRQLLEACGVGTDRLFLVPGNHDMSRGSEKAAWEKLRALNRAAPDETAQWLAGLPAPRAAKAPWRDAVRARSDNFWQWVANDLKRPDLLPENNPHGRLGYRRTIDLPGLPFPVQVIGLDSAWLSGDDHDAGKLCLTSQQINLLACAEGGQPLPGYRLALMHHPLGDLADSHTAFGRLADTVDLVLHGHQHTPMASLHETPDRHLRVLAAGSLYEGDQGDNWLNAFDCIDAELDDQGTPLRYEVRYWGWSKEGHWHPSGAMFKAAPNGILHIELAGAGNPAPRAAPAAVTDLQARVGRSAWCREIAESRLWESLESASAILAERVLIIVLRAEHQVAAAFDKLPGDRWRDAAMPARVAKRIATLLSKTGAALSPAEAALALVVPYVYEAILAAGALLLAEQGDPFDPLASTDERGAGRAWRILHHAFRADEILGRRRDLLLARGETTAAQDLSAWRMNRFLHASGELWEYVPDAVPNGGGWANAALDSLFAAPAAETAATDPRIGRILDGARLVRLARLMFADPEEIQAARSRDAEQMLRDDERIGDSPGEWRLREASIAHLLSLAASMAADPRRLDSVLAEHLGMSAQISAAKLRSVYAQVSWHWTEHSLVMHLVCPHEAIDLAAQRLVATLDAHCKLLHSSSQGLDDSLRATLPHYFSDLDVKAAIVKAKPCYQRPHLQLMLDQGRILQLLMGTSLYGRPELALRELYQNALDACRLRRARVAYLRSLNGAVPEYTGKITFETGYDDNRPFIQCVDNGIGMGERHLRSFFAQAGRRFTDSHEYHVEQAAWSEQGIRCFQNGRFGIGVFSYFMIADELVVRTKRLKANGEDWETGLHASIVGGSSLFRIHDLDTSGGTQVRLYLRDQQGLHDLMERMLDWLWLPEFDTTFLAPTAEPIRLPRGVPTAGFTRVTGVPLPVQRSADENDCARLFWRASLDPNRRAEGALLLVDGILTKHSDDDLVAPFLIVDLKGDLRPELTVDREKVVSWETGRDYVTGMLRQGAWQDLLAAPALDLVEMERALEAWPLALMLIDRGWRAGEVAAVVPPCPPDPDDRHGTRICRLAQYPLGVAPLLDDMVMAPWRAERGSPRGRGRHTGPRFWNVDLLDRIHGKALARWVAARALALMEAGIALPEPQQMLAHFADANQWHDVPSLGLALLHPSFERDDGYFTSLSVAHILKVALAWSLTLGEVAELARPLAGFGVVLPDLARLPPGRSVTGKTAMMLRLIFEDTRWKGEIQVGALLDAAVRRSMTPAELAAAADDLAALGVPLPEAMRVELPVQLNEVHRRLVSHDLDGKSPWLDALSFARLLDAADIIGLPLAEIAAHAEALASLGFSAPDLRAFLGDRHQQLLLSCNLDGRAPWVRSLGPTHLLRFAVTHAVSLADAAATAQALARLGIQIPEIGPDPGPLVPSERELALPMRREFSGVRVGAVPLERMLEAASKWSLPLAEVAALARPLARLGFEVAAIDKEAGELVPSERQLMLLSIDLDTINIGTDAVPASRLVAAAIEWDLPLGAVDTLAQPLARLGIAMPPIDQVQAEWRPSPLQALLLSRNLDARAPWHDTIPLGHLLDAQRRQSITAAELAEACRPLEALGIVAPGCAALGRMPPPPKLIELLSLRLEGNPPWREEIDGMQLLRASAAWSMPVGAIIEIARPYGVLHASLPALDAALLDFVPTERHLLLLTKSLDERSPAVDELPLGHLCNAAVEWGLSLVQVFELARPLQQLGLAVLPHLTPIQLNFVVSERQVILLSQDLDGQAPWEEQLSARHLRRAASKFDWPLSLALRTAAPLRALGIAMPAWGHLGRESNERADRLLDHLGQMQDALYAWDVAEVALQSGATVAKFSAALATVSAMNIDVSDARAFVEFCADPRPQAADAA